MFPFVLPQDIFDQNSFFCTKFVCMPWVPWQVLSEERIFVRNSKKKTIYRKVIENVFDRIRSNFVIVCTIFYLAKVNSSPINMPFLCEKQEMSFKYYEKISKKFNFIEPWEIVKPLREKWDNTF